ncbi:MAG TPA: FAD-dependent oxidoreductase [Vicinamibacterales bacterium]|nr:FAD-dependent oxidoreductase [Vicinamibacterales bacterium]
MSKPIILTIDDDANVLAAIERDLKARYRSDYRILKAGSGREGIETVEELKRRGVPIALFLVDQRMPGMSGTEFLIEARKLYPDSRKILLTAYADTDTAIASINTVGLDFYLLKPWDPPRERLYPVLDDVLADWTAHVRLPFEGIRVAGALWSRQCYEAKEFLSLNRVPYQWLDIDRDAAARELVERLTGGVTRLPVVMFTDGSHLVAPTRLELAQKVGLRTEATQPFYDLIVIGAGPAGLAAAVYGGSEGLRTLVIEQSAPGGQAGTSSRIENYLGFPAGITGADLAFRATTQVRRFGAELLTAQQAIGLRREDPYRMVRLANGHEVSGYTVVIASGMDVRTLDAPGVEELLGSGVYYGAAPTEGAIYRGQDVAVVGGANSAGQGALFCARTARKVTILVRGSGLKPAMSQYLVDRIEATPNIEVVSHAEVSRVQGKGRLDAVTIRNVETGEERSLATAALFVFIGTAPRSQWAAELVARDDKGFIMTGPDVPRTNGHGAAWSLDRDPFLFETSVPGVFAAGDVRSGANRRVAMAVGEGSAVVHSIHRYLETV